MKIVSHECHSYCEICGKDLSERIAYLEESVKDWHKVADQRSKEIIKQFERIKVLEDALRKYVNKFGNCGDVYDKAIEILEVK